MSTRPADMGEPQSSPERVAPAFWPCTMGAGECRHPECEYPQAPAVAQPSGAAEPHPLTGANREWLAANAPGGWIDELRKENAQLRAALASAQQERDEAILTVNGLAAERDSAQAQIAALTARAEQAEAALYVPNQWVCATCGFCATKLLLRAADGAVGIDTREVQDICPNDGTSLRRLTWEQHATEALVEWRKAIERATSTPAADTSTPQE